MPKCLVDTNVILIADGKNDDAGNRCIANCIKKLSEVCRDGGLVLDDGDRIFSEYLNKTKPWNPQTSGELFVKWVNDNRMNPVRCDRVQITPTDDDAENFEEFPTDPRLARFERADRAFVAVANAHPEKPPIAVAIDTDYRMPDHRAAFADSGITIDYLCEDDLDRVYERKYGER